MQFARPELPDELSDRKQDVAEPLLAIADAAGGEWPSMARQAVIELCAEARTWEESIGVQLLSDIRDIFTERQTDRISSDDLATALAAIETSPWAEWSRGKPITKFRLAPLLRHFGIISGNIRLPDGRTPKGYRKEDFADDWERYLPSNTPQSPSTPFSKRHNATTRINIDDSADFGNATPTLCGDSENSEIPNKNGACGVVAFQKEGEEGLRGIEGHDPDAQGGSKAVPVPEGYLPDSDGAGCTCRTCGDHFGTVAGWRYHVIGKRCTPAEGRIRTEAAD